MPENDASSRLIAEPNTILRGLVGSTVHGLVLTGTGVEWVERFLMTTYETAWAARER